MVNMFMRIDKMKTGKGGATVSGLPGKGCWMAIDTYHWQAVRHVPLSIGDGANADTGKMGMSEVRVTKQSDGASEGLLSFLFSPGKSGKDIEIVFTKPSGDANGVNEYFSVKLQDARLTNYSISGSDGAQPSEVLEFCYTQLDQLHYSEDETGDLHKGGLVSFHVPTGKMTSGVKS